MKYLVPALCMLFCMAVFAEDGKVFLKSDPAGAEVFLVETDAEQKITMKSLDKKTATLLQLPQGKQKLLLKLVGYKDATVEVDVAGTAILKPDVIKLEKPTVDVDLIFEDGWTVFIDKQSAKDKTGKLAVTPCTISLPCGTLDVTLSKNGFEDIKQKLTVDKSTAITIVGKPKKDPKAPKEPEPKEQNNGYARGWVWAKYAKDGSVETDTYTNQKTASNTEGQDVLHGFIVVPEGKSVLRLRGHEWAGVTFRASGGGTVATVRQESSWLLIKIKNPHPKNPTLVEVKWSWQKGDFKYNFEWIFDEKSEEGWGQIPVDAFLHNAEILGKYKKK